MTRTRPSVLGLAAAALLSAAAGVSAVLLTRGSAPAEAVLVMLVLVAQAGFAVFAAIKRTVRMLFGVSLLSFISVFGPLQEIAALVEGATVCALGAAGWEWAQTRAVGAAE